MEAELLRYLESLGPTWGLIGLAIVFGVRELREWREKKVIRNGKILELAGSHMVLLAQMVENTSESKKVLEELRREQHEQTSQLGKIDRNLDEHNKAAQQNCDRMRELVLAYNNKG